MKNFARTFAFTLVAVAAVAMAAEKVAVGDLIKEADKYDNKTVRVIGKVVGFKQKTSKAGNSYFNFKLDADGKKITVYGQGKLEKELKDDQKVEVIGLFKKEVKVGDNVFKNELDVTKKDSIKDSKEFGITVKD